MMASYGETSGFSQISNDEMVAVNGGLGPALVLGCVALAGIVAVSAQGCPQPTNSNALDRDDGNGGGGGK